MSSPATARVRPTAPDEREAGCPECDGRLERDAAEAYCGDCGLLVEAPQLDYRNTRMLRADHDTDPRPRQRATDTRHDGGLTTQIGYAGESYRHPNTNGPDFGRLLWQHERSRTKGKHERNRRKAFSEIRRLVAGLELPGVVRRTACRLFKRFHDDGHLMGRAYEVYASAIVYAAARLHHYPITMHDLADLARVEEKRVWRGLSTAKQELELSVPPLQAGDLVSRVASAVEYDPTPGQRERMVELARLVDGATGVENAPHGLAAAAVYLGANGRMNGEVTQADVADAADCTRATLRQGMRAIEGVQERGAADGELAADGGREANR